MSVSWLLCLLLDDPYLDEGAPHSVRQPSIMQLLLRNVTDVSSKNINDWTPLNSVAGLNRNPPQVRPQTRIEVCHLLLPRSRHKARATALRQTVSAKDAADVKFLLKSGADTSFTIYAGETALHRACQMIANDTRIWECHEAGSLSAERLEVICLLLEHRAVLEARDRSLVSLSSLVRTCFPSVICSLPLDHYPIALSSSRRTCTCRFDLSAT
jgi:hypothetical protein